MDFLALCNDVARETGTLSGGASLVSVTGLTGRADKIANWVRNAWLNIQNERDQWFWMIRDFTASVTVAGGARYTGAQLSQTRVAKWIGDSKEEITFSIYDPAIGLTDEGEITEISWALWRSRYGRGYHDPGKPIEWAASPQNELCLGPTPDQNYTIRGLYRLTPQTLTASADIPEMPERFHRCITWEAIRALANSDEAQISANTATQDFVLLRQALNRDQLPATTVDLTGDGPIA